MGFGTIVCSYIYGTFLIIVGAVDAYQQAAKAMLERIESLAQAAITFWKYTVEKAIELVVNLVKIYEKKLVDMIYDPTGSTLWCGRLWDCLTFVNDLLDPDSFLFKKLNDWFSQQCTTFVNADLLNNIRALLSDFQTFAQTLCSYGFSFEFGISMIKEILNTYKKQLTGYEDQIMQKIKTLKNFCMQYLNWAIDTGVVDYLEKLEGLFNCIIDSSETCASIATSSNYYKNVCSKMHIEKNGDTWGMDSNFKNSVYGGLEGSTIRLRNAKMDIDSICDTLANPKEVKRANKAYNLSKNIFPGGLHWSDLTTEDGNLSWTKIKSGETWKKTAIYQKYDQTRQALQDAWNREPKLTTEQLADGTEIDEYGNIYYRDGCDLIPLEPEELPYEEQTVEEFYATENGSNEVLKDGDKFISVTQAALKIAKEPDSDLAKRCEEIWRKLNAWAQNNDSAKKYGTARI